MLLGSYAVSNLIRENKIFQIDGYLETASNDGSGMQSLDFCLFKLLKQGEISIEEAVKLAIQPESLKRGGRAARGMMDAKARDKALERARTWRRQVSRRRREGLPGSRRAGGRAARVLGTLRRPRDAAQLLIEEPRRAAGQASRLDAAGGRSGPLMAAIFLGRAGDNPRAVQLFMSLGEQQRAVELLQKAGDSVGAAKLAAMKPGQFETGPMLAPAKATAVGGQAVSMATAQKLEETGKLEAALQSYLSLKRFADAGRCAKALGRRRMPPSSMRAGLPLRRRRRTELGDTERPWRTSAGAGRGSRYRVAAAMAVRMATNLNVLDFASRTS